MAKKRAAKRRVWNKGLEVGKRDGFTPDQVKRIRGLLANRGVPGLRDLALFSTAIDTMLHGQDLLALVVGDVQRRDGSMRPVIEVARARGMPASRVWSSLQDLAKTYNPYIEGPTDLDWVSLCFETEISRCALDSCMAQERSNCL